MTYLAKRLDPVSSEIVPLSAEISHVECVLKYEPIVLNIVLPRPIIRHSSENLISYASP